MPIILLFSTLSHALICSSIRKTVCVESRVTQEVCAILRQASPTTAGAP